MAPRPDRPRPAGGRARGVVIAVAVLALAGTGLVAGRLLDAADTPQLVVTAGPTAEPWLAGWDGRPAGGVELAVTASVLRQDRGGRTVTVRGPAGAGVVAVESPAVTLSPVHGRPQPVAVPLRARIDCTAVPLAPSAPAAYRLRATADRGAAPAVRDPDGAGERWARDVRDACATWTARRDLTVTALTARVDPLRPAADLEVRVVNAGRYDARLTAPAGPAPGVVATAGLPVRVPAGGAVTVRVAVRLDRCDVVGSVVYGSVGSPVLSSWIGLAATAGAEGPEGAVPDRAGDAAAPTGIVLAAPAGRALGAALVQACGGTGPVTSLVPPDGVRWDPASRRLVVAAVVDVTPGVVRHVSLQPDPASGTSPRLVPAWTTTPELQPDAGRVRVSLPYHLTGGTPCGAADATLLGLVATLRVAADGGERVVRYSLFLELVGPARAGAGCGG